MKRRTKMVEILCHVRVPLAWPVPHARREATCQWYGEVYADDPGMTGQRSLFPKWGRARLVPEGAPDALSALRIAKAELWRLATDGMFDLAPIDDDYDDMESAYINGASVATWEARGYALRALVATGDGKAAKMLAEHEAAETERDAQEAADE